MDRGLDEEVELRALAVGHFRRFGEVKGRDDRVDFAVKSYLANHTDLWAPFADGPGGCDEEAATLHWPLSGFAEGRDDESLTG